MSRYKGRNYFIVRHDLASFQAFPGVIWNSGRSPKDRPVGFVFVVKLSGATVAQEVQRHPAQLPVRTTAKLPQQVTVGVFHLDDVGSEVTQNLNGQGPHHNCRQIDDPKAGERSRRLLWSHRGC